ncbi:MAG: glycosyltransferase family 9 protein [bacterium]|nr:glycosyltransferase family 9 protein [bacterium]
MEAIKSDCRHMRWDRPCDPHKREGVHCDRCPHYAPVDRRTLVIKLDALGDVLRTTCILPGLKKAFPKTQVTWITMPAAAPLLLNNPHVDRVVPYGPEALALLAVEEFDDVLCLDAAPRSAALGGRAKGKSKRGFGLEKRGRVFPFNREAEEWFLMGLFDDIKRRNRRTYQDIVMEICGLSGQPQEIVLRLTEGERAFARRFAERAGLPAERERARNGVRVIGLNTGSGARWPMKQWPVGHCAEFVRACLGKGDCRILLFGGEEERARNREILAAAGEGLIDTGCGNSLREFMALIGLCDVLVTGDTLGLHAALGLGRKVVALFGPTSAAEIDVYGRGIKIASRSACACCYLRECERSPSCMEEIKPAEVLAAALKLLAK